MTTYQIVSADSHMCEPPDLWTSRVDKQFRDRAPAVVTGSEGKEGIFFSFGGAAPPIPVPGTFGAGASAEELPELVKKGFETAPPST